MSLIVAGRFQTFEKAEAAASRLFARGFLEEDVSLFYVNPPGQHHNFPIGGDAYADRSMQPAHKTAGAGIVIGSVVGAAAGAAIVMALHLSSLIFIIGAALGAYIGSLIGAMGGTRKAHEDLPVRVSNHEVKQPVRESGVLLAVHVTSETERKAEDALREEGARDVEHASGRWQRGKWSDFNPVSAPATSH
jgi:hypothetical protein